MQVFQIYLVLFVRSKCFFCTCAHSRGQSLPPISVKGFGLISHLEEFSVQKPCLHAGEDPGKYSCASPLTSLILKCVRGTLFLQVWTSGHACRLYLELTLNGFIFFIALVLFPGPAHL